MKFLNRIGFTTLPVRCVDTCKSIKVVEVYCQKVLDKYVVAFTCLFSCTEVFKRKLKLVRKGYSSDCLRWSLIKFHNSLLILILIISFYFKCNRLGVPKMVWLWFLDWSVWAWHFISRFAAQRLLYCSSVIMYASIWCMRNICLFYHLFTFFIYIQL